jgi:monofunctional biosynthetic peptidoglycan transglycosylase
MRYREAELGLAPGTYRSEWVPLDRISPVLICAVVKAEDRGFFRHQGFEWEQMRRAVAQMARGGIRAGGSTITQQTARNLFLSPERTIGRKLREGLIAGRLEVALPKERILAIYLNTIEWGEGVWGIDAASRYYFDKEPSVLDAFESILLASLVAAPRRPLAGANAERARKVQFRLLHQLYVSRLLTPTELRSIKGRFRELYKALGAGRALSEAVRRHDAVGDEDRQRAGGPEITSSLPGIVAGECGLDHEMRVAR